MTAPALVIPDLRGGACREVGGDLFFPEKGGSTRRAKAICGGCEVRVECLQWALDNDEGHGIWGGLTAKERGRLARGRRRSSAARQVRGKKPINHGTEGGFVAHYRHKDLPACEPCRQANSEAKQRRKAKGEQP